MTVDEINNRTPSPTDTGSVSAHGEAVPPRESSAPLEHATTEAPSAAEGVDELSTESPAPDVEAPEPQPAPRGEPAQDSEQETAPAPPIDAPEPTPTPVPESAHVSDEGASTPDDVDAIDAAGPGALGENKQRMSEPPKLNIGDPVVADPAFTAARLDDPEQTPIDHDRLLQEQRAFFGRDPEEQVFEAKRGLAADAPSEIVSQRIADADIQWRPPSDTVAFLRERPFYVDDAGQVWGVHVDDEQSVSLVRADAGGAATDTPFQPTYEPRSPEFEAYRAERPYMQDEGSADPDARQASIRQTLSASGDSSVTVYRTRDAAPGVSDRTATTKTYEHQVSPAGAPMTRNLGTRTERRLEADDPVGGHVQIDSVSGSVPGLVEGTSVTRSTRRGTSVRINDVAEPTPPTTVEEVRALRTQLEVANTRMPRMDPDADPSGSVDAVFDLAQRTEHSYDTAAIERAIAHGFGVRGNPAGAQMARTMADDALSDAEQRMRELGFTDEDGITGVGVDAVASGGLGPAKYNSDLDVIELAGRPVDTTADGTVQLPFAIADDVIAHELTHRLTDINVPGFSQSGGNSQAISESLADTISAAIDTDEWVMGESVAPGGVRDMSERHTISELPADGSGRSHDMGQIANTAAHDIGERVGRDAMGRIYTDVIRNRLREGMTFEDLARSTIDAAVQLYGADSAEAAASRDAWNGTLELHGADQLR